MKDFLGIKDEGNKMKEILPYVFEFSHSIPFSLLSFILYPSSFIIYPLSINAF